MEARVRLVVLGRDASRSDADHAAGDDEGSVAVLQDRADGFDDAAVRVGGGLHLGEVVVVAEVDDAVTLGDDLAQSRGVIE